MHMLYREKLFMIFTRCPSHILPHFVTVIAWYIKIVTPWCMRARTSNTRSFHWLWLINLTLTLGLGWMNSYHIKCINFSPTNHFTLIELLIDMQKIISNYCRIRLVISRTYIFQNLLDVSLIYFLLITSLQVDYRINGTINYVPKCRDLYW